VSADQASLSPAFLLAHFLTARELLEDAASSNADLCADQYHSLVARARVGILLDQHRNSTAQIRRFGEFTFGEGKSIREAVNSGQVPVRDIIHVLERSRRFREWIAEKPPQADLVREYYKEATAVTWVERLPTKTVRWLLFSGLGLAADAFGAGGVGTVIGLGIGGFDSLILDRLVHGWKPNQFVEGDLRNIAEKTPAASLPDAV